MNGIGFDLFRVKKFSGKIFGKRYYSGKKGGGVKNFWDFFDWMGGPEVSDEKSGRKFMRAIAPRLLGADGQV